MTDAAIPLTERAVEQFVESYLTLLGAEVEKDGRRWKVTVPSEVDTPLPLTEAVLVVTTDPSEVAEDEWAIAPESEFVQRLLDEAADQQPVGSLTLAAETTSLDVPGWISEGRTEIIEQAFTPYYDRAALCALFHVGVETVSDFQTEELRAVAVDKTSGDALPELAETYLDQTDVGRADTTTGEEPTDFDPQPLLETAFERVEEQIDPRIRSIRQNATDAAMEELNEYKQYRRQRLDEITDELDRLNERIAEMKSTIDSTTDQSERVEALQKRKDLQSERDELKQEREEIHREIEAGFPEKRGEIRDRHSLTVRLRPVTLTHTTYERGDLSLTLRDGSETTEITTQYAVGVGTTEDHPCVSCGSPLTEANPAVIVDGEIHGEACCSR